MDISSNPWISELGIMESLEYNVSLSPESFSSCTTDDIFGGNGHSGVPLLSIERSHKLVKTNSRESSSTNTNEKFVSSNYRSHPSTAPQFLSFGNTNTLQFEPKGLTIKPKVEAGYEPMVHDQHQSNNDVKATLRSNKRGRPSNMASAPNSVSQEHVVAERRRREKLNRNLVALSALLPGLTKMDKATVLGDAIKYVKQLQGRVETLEDKLKGGHAQSVVVKKSYLTMDDIDEAGSSSFNQGVSKSHEIEVSLPEIEGKVKDKDVFLLIHCEKQQGLLGTILNEMEKLDLCVTNSNSMPYGTYDLVITITATIKQNHSIQAKDIVRKLKLVL